MIYRILLSADNGLMLLTTDGFGERFAERAQEKLHDTECITWEGRVLGGQGDVLDTTVP